jgi:hypothetical protein
VVRLTRALLNLGNGVAVDDYSDHLWSSSELVQDEEVVGRTFFKP